MTRRSMRPRAKRVFVGCEGQSEQGYARLLQEFVNDAGVAINIKTRVWTGAGDPLVLIQQALTLIKKDEQQPMRKYKGRFLMFDTDRLGQSHDRDRELEKLARKNDLVLVRQNLCFESVLLRHFAGHENDDPATSSDALKRLQRVWPDYRKGMAAMDLSKRIDPGAVRRAANPRLNSGLHQLVVAIGLLNNQDSGC